MFYFDHSVNASKDDKILSLRLAFGGAAVDAYWSIIEKLYEEETPLVFKENQTETKALTHWLCVGFDDLETWVLAMVESGLLVNCNTDNNGDILLWSNRVQERIDEVNKKAETARQNGKKGGRPKAEKPKETKSVILANPKKATKTKTKTKTIDLNNKENIKRMFDEAEQENASFSVQCLKIYNETMGRNLCSMPPKSAECLNLRKDRYTLDEVSGMVKMKREQWTGTKMEPYLKPTTIFSPEHFDEYMEEYKHQNDEREFSNDEIPY